jgi:hypothetical protein
MKLARQLRMPLKPKKIGSRGAQSIKNPTNQARMQRKTLKILEIGLMQDCI